ncbi:MAG: phosphoethanolamine--lipid A transferase [Gammaproteobacteria bacterium]|nr:phosphoethanolamine--lipid A transferase [Gammaproteobacteria bacterium]
MPATMRIPSRDITPESLAFLAAAYMVLFCNSRFWSETLHLIRPGTPEEVAFAASLPLLLTALYFLVLLPVLSHRTLKPLLVTLFFANALALYFIDTYHAYIDRGMVRNVLQTDWRESTELLDVRMAAYLVLFGALPTLALRHFRLRTDAPRRVLARRLGLLTGTIAVMATVMATLSQQFMFFGREHRELQYLLVPANYITAGLTLLRGPGTPAGARIPIGPDATPGASWQATDRPLLLILVVGETARAEAFSLNGYARDTNPELRRRQVINFPDVHSCGTSTAESLPCMFRPFGHDGPDTEDLKQYESLLDVVERAGVDVLWLDNNAGCKGVCAGVEARSLAGSHDAGLCSADGCHDEILLRHLRQVLSGPAKSRVVVLHQQGSHGPAYFRRYPAAFRRFRPDCNHETLLGCTSQEIRNAYDNTILYTDHVLGQLIDLLHSTSDVYDTAMLYVSDHGESLGENGVYLHGLPYFIAPETQTRVPMIFWMSDEFAARSGIGRSCLKHAATAAYSHDNLFASTLGLLDIETTSHDPRRDIFAACRQAGHPVT